jgi:hypothetical protein
MVILALTEIALVEEKQVIRRKVKKGVPSIKNAEKRDRKRRARSLLESD